MKPLSVEDGICEHEFELLDAGPYSDDIYYEVCKKCRREKRGAVPVATPTLKDEVESATSECVFNECVHPGNCHQRCIHDGRATKPAPTLKDEVYAMLDGLNVPGQLCGETVRILTPHLEDAVKWRKR